MLKKLFASRRPLPQLPPPPARSVIGAFVLQAHNARMSYNRRDAELTELIDAAVEERRQVRLARRAIELALTTADDDHALVADERVMTAAPLDDQVAAILDETTEDALMAALTSAMVPPDIEGKDHVQTMPAAA